MLPLGALTEFPEIDTIATTSTPTIGQAEKARASGSGILAERSSRPGVNGGRGEARLWARVNRLLDYAPSLEDLRAHQLELLALVRWREMRRPIPGDLVAEAERAALKSLAAPLLLQRVRDVCDGPIVLLKGPEAAAYYPRPSSRSFTDLDVLVPDAFATQRALTAAGFRLAGEAHRYRGGHHLQPVCYPGFPLIVEVHIRPKWVEGIPPPPVDELLEVAIPSAVPVAGISALPPIPHALVMAVHAWAHQPLGSLRQLIDVAAALQGTSPPDSNTLATAWGIERIWLTTTAAIDALFFGARPPWPLRLWARNLAGVRERSVLATHLERWFAGFAAYPIRHAARVSVRAVQSDLRPVSDEGWRTKLRRTGKALKNSFARRSRHETEQKRMLGGPRLSRGARGRRSHASGGPAGASTR